MFWPCTVHHKSCQKSLYRLETFALFVQKHRLFCCLQSKTVSCFQLWKLILLDSIINFDLRKKLTSFWEPFWSHQCSLSLSSSQLQSQQNHKRHQKRQCFVEKKPLLTLMKVSFFLSFSMVYFFLLPSFSLWAHAFSYVRFS